MRLIDEERTRERRTELVSCGWRFSVPIQVGGEFLVVASSRIARAEFQRTNPQHAEVDAVCWAGCEQDLAEELRAPVAAE